MTDQSITDLLAVMAKLRDPDGGCPWDLEQDFKSIVPHTIEEAYEVADAVDRGDMADLKDELGDLLFQVVYHAQLAKEAGDFDFDDVVRHVKDKMVGRHPHVFGEATARTAADVNALWEQRKDAEGKRSTADSLLDDVTRALPALSRGQKLQNRAARVGFEWSEAAYVLDKLDEEAAEMREALAGGRIEEIRDELGDLFFVLTNFGRMLGMDCEEVMRQANGKFERRFRYIEQALKTKGMPIKDAGLDAMEDLWREAKEKEKPSA